MWGRCGLTPRRLEWGRFPALLCAGFDSVCLAPTLADQLAQIVSNTNAISRSSTLMDFMCCDANEWGESEAVLPTVGPLLFHNGSRICEGKLK